MTELLSSFQDLIARVRSGEEEAARELVIHFETLIRREVRVRLIDRELLRVLDSMDIAQSVFKSFFNRAGAGHFDLETPEQLAGLLISMARIKLAFQRRKHHALRRDIRLTNATRVEEMEIISLRPGPSQLASEGDLREAVLLRFGHEEREVFGMRAEGWEWAEIAARLGGSAQSRRMQLARAVLRVSLEFKKEGICV